MRSIALTILFVCVAVTARAGIHTETVEYKSGDTTLKGYLAYDDASKEKRPAVIVVHEWWGLNDYAKMRTRALAELGYVAFAADIYGDGMVTEHAEHASEWSQQVGSNMPTGIERFNAALKLIRANDRVDPARVATIGYCFGGSVALAVALNGADVDGVVTFHAGLPTQPAKGKVTAKLLVCNGADDALLTKEAVDTFVTNLKASGADWQMITYGGAKHSFTVPSADKRGIPVLAYNEKADKRSWQAMRAFFDEIFGE